MLSLRPSVLGLLLFGSLIGAYAVAPGIVAEEPSKTANPAEKKHQAKGKTEPMMKCPMMAGLSDLRLFADSPAALLARAEELGLDVKQKRQLEEIEEAARLQARKLLSDKQWEQVRQAPPGRLPMMQMASMGMKGKKMDGCCPMCLKMMQANDSKAEEKHDHKAEAKPKEEKDDQKAKGKSKD